MKFTRSKRESKVNALPVSVASGVHAMHGWKFIVPEGQSCNHFFTTQVGNRNVVAFLRHDAIAPPVLAAEPAVKLPAVSVYSLNAGTVDGVNIGYLMWSPLRVVVDPFFALFSRPQFDPFPAVKEGAESKNMYQLRGGVSVFVIDDDACLFTFHTPSRITEALES